MALFSPQREGLAATLSKPGDFLDWEHAYRIQAERLDLQQYLKRKTFLRDKPALPDIRKRKYTKTAQAQRTIRSETQESQESSQDDIQETANGTWVVSDLTEQGQKTFQQDLAFYQLEERIFTDEKKALGTLKDWVLRTVSPSFIRTCCQPHESIYEWHYNLRARCGRSEADETRDARNRYLTLLKTAPKTTSQAIQWLDKWEEALAKGQQRKVPETLYCSSWAYDFFNISSNILPAWTAAYEISQQSLIQDEALIYRDLANAFRNKLQNAEAANSQGSIRGRIARGVFSASFAGEDPQDDEGDAHIIEGQYRSTKKGGRKTKRQRSPDGQEKCPACSLPHVLEKCFYVYPNLAWKGFRPRGRLQTKVKEALEEDLGLQAQVKALTRKRPKIPSQPTKEEELDQ
ncbi:hypothetical protein Forpe1208_v016190 [Fusarium oxysporum f. sp. rapae]|uniref:Gag protein n=1 Tax=Fusarium oxysporum f. sp. rapae TaxID=485398 RepID=A0A8J5NIE7_FUSOX|nr:hypothetical protein Forpe1208_v016190 [Fusarium oxysporum f. sp. rapae]